MSQPYILIVDDDPIMRRLIEVYLCDHYLIKSFASGQEILDYLDQNSNVDLIISDIMMPEIDGFELRERLLKQKSTELIPFVFLTGAHDEQVEDQAFQLGVDDYLIKPVNREHLNAVLRRTLRRSKQIQQAIGKHYEFKITNSLRPSLPKKIRNYTVELHNREASAGGGDMVLRFEKENSDILVLADVMGHGFEAKFFVHAYAGYLYGTMRSMPLEITPSLLLSKFSEAIIEDEFLKKSLLTCVALEIFDDGRVDFASAGHPKPLILRNDKAREVDVKGILPGIPVSKGREDIFVYKTKTETIEKGEKIFLYTDGLFDASPERTEREEITKSTLKLLRNSCDKTPSEISDKILKLHKKNFGDQISDDLTFIILERDA